MRFISFKLKKTMRKYKILFLLFLILSANSWMQAQTIALRISDTTVVTGNTIDIPIYADSSLTGKGVLSYMLQLTFNQNYIQPLAVITAGTLSSGFGSPTINVSVPGKITIAGAGTTPLTGKGVFAIVRFKTIQSGSSWLNFNTGTQNNYFNEGIPVLTFDDAYINISALPSINVYPDNQTLTKGDQVQFYVSGGTAPFLWSLTDPAVASIDPAGLLTGTQFGITKVIAQDANGIRDTSNTIEIKAMRLSIPNNLSQLPGTDIDIPINSTDLTGLSIVSGNFTVSYYENALTPVGIIQAGTLLESFPAPAYNQSIPGKVTFAFAGATPISGSGVLIYLRFHISATNTGGSWLNFDNALFNQNLYPTLVNSYLSANNLANINISSGNSFLIAGEKMQFSVYGGGIPPFVWTVSDSVASSIDQSGLLTALKSGNITISVKDSVGATAIQPNFRIYDTRISMPDTSICPVSPTFYYPIQIKALPSGKSVFSLQGSIEYDTTYLTFMALETAGSLTQGWTYSINPVGRDIIFAGSGSSSFNSEGVIAFLKFTLKPNFVLGSNAGVNLRNILFNEGDPQPYYLSYSGRILAAIPGYAQSITGTYNVCQGQTDLVYSVPPITGATGYVWTVPFGTTILSGANTNSITVSFSDSAYSDYFKVYGTNACGDGYTSPWYYVNVNSVPLTTGIISGPDNVCEGQLSVNYSAYGISNATSFEWTLPSGTTGSSTSNYIYLDFATAKDSGIIAVKAANSCGFGPELALPVKIHSIPAAPGAITGPVNVFLEDYGVSYSVAPVAGATSYTWTLPSGVYGASSTNTITADFSVSAMSGNIGVRASNPCGSGPETSLAIIISPKPVVCQAMFDYVSSGALTFTDKSQGNPAFWSWDFGDGTFSAEQNPTHLYFNQGAYDVTLSISNPVAGCVSSVTNRVIAGSISCQADFDFVIDTLTGIVNFTSLSQHSSEYYWTFGDSYSSSSQNPRHQFLSTGTYEVTLSIRNPSINCMDMVTKLIQVGSTDCSAGFNYIVNNSNLNVSYKDNSKGQIEFYYWDFGDGTFSTDQNPDHVYLAPNIYLVSQFVINLTNSCVDFKAESVQVGEIDCSADFITYIDSINSTAYFTNRVIGVSTAKLWSFGDGSYSTQDNPIHRFPGAGIYSAGLNTFNLNTGCMDYYAEMLIVGEIGNDCNADFIYRVDPVNPVVTFNNTSVGDIVESVWNFGDESPISLEKDPIHSYSQGGYYNVCLTVTNSQGIKNMGCKWVLVEGSTLNDCLAGFMFSIDSTNLTARFADNSFGNIDSYTWDFGDSSADSVSFNQNPSHIYSQKGYYLVQLKVENTLSGCVSNEYKLLNIADNQILKAAFGYEAQVPVKKFTGYPVDLVSASSGDGATVEWDFGDKQLKKGAGDFMVMDSTSRNVTHYYALPGKYEVCLRISDPVSKKSDIYCNFVYTKNALGIDDPGISGINLNVYPNPFVSSTTVSYSLEKSQQIEISLYDQLGRKIETLEKARQEPGTYAIHWDAKSALPGIYHLKFISGDGILTKQIVLSK
jgi:PKD repeat protein